MRRSLGIIVVVAVVLVAAIGYGRDRRKKIFDLETNLAAANAELAKASALLTEKNGLLSEVARLRRELEKRQTPTLQPLESNAGVTTNSRVAERLGALAEFHKRRLIYLRVPFLRVGDALDPAFIELLNLNPSEAESIQRSISHARNQIDALAIANSRVTTQANIVEIVVRPFEGGGQVYDELMDELSRTLGPERTNAFNELWTDSLMSAMNYFGAAERTLRIGRNSSGAYTLEEERSSKDETSETAPMTLSNPAQLKKAIGKLVEVIPDGF